jgi:hypothetical protein
MAEVRGSSPLSSTSGDGCNSLTKAALIVLMALGSVLLWVGAPIGWLYVGSQVQAHSHGAGFGPDAVVLGGIAISVVVLTKALAALSRAYDGASGQTDPVRVRLPWHRSMRGDEDSRPPRSVLDVVMVISVVVAVTAMTIWFFLFAGSSLPTS